MSLSHWWPVIPIPTLCVTLAVDACCADADAGTITAILEALVVEVRKRGIQAIAIPPLGSGLGGLDWNQNLANILKIAKLANFRALIVR